jgi:hypothetical protein
LTLLEKLNKERKDGRGLGLGFSLFMSEKEKGRTKPKNSKVRHSKFL